MPKSFFNSLLLIIVSFLIAGASLSGAEEIEMKIPVLSAMADGSTGFFYRLPFKYSRYSDGRPLRVSIVDDTPNGSKEGVRSSVWLAAVTLSMLKNDPLDGVSISVEFTGMADGPSAGGVFCLATWLAYEGKKLPEDFAMTGTIMPDGTIGMVGGVGKKIRAAAQKGIKRICIPAFIRFEEQSDGKYWDLYQEGEKYGVKIYPVKTITEAYEVVTGEKVLVSSLPSETEILALPRNLEKVLINSCTNSIQSFGEHAQKEHLKNYYEWSEIARNGAFPHGELYYTELIAFWDYLKRGKILSALETSQEIRAAYGDYAKTDVFSMYNSLRSNEAFEILRTKTGDSEYTKLKLPPYNRYNREKVRKYAADLRSSIASFKSTLEVKNEAVLNNPFVADGNLSEIASQSEQFDLEYLPLFLYYANLYSAISVQDIEVLSDNELYLYVSTCQALYYFVCVYLNSFDSDLYVKNRQLIYSNLPSAEPNDKLSQYEASFYSSLLSMYEVINHDYKEYEDVLKSSKNTLVEEINSGYNILNYKVGILRRMHGMLDEESKVNLSYHRCAILYQHSQALAKACALSVKFHGDVNRTENIFVQFLTRMARESALRSIYECKRAEVPCIDPVLKFEQADFFMGKSGYDPVKVLEYYWCAHLGAKALLAGFESEY